MKLFDLTGKVALVTGGNGGIGLAMSKAMGEAGATIIIAGRNEEKNTQSIKILNSQNIECKSFHVDVVDENSCNKLIEKVISNFGKLNILVNNLRKRFKGDISPRYAKRKIDNIPLELTSRVPTSEVSETKARLALKFSEPIKVDRALATNMISVGLDITRLGLMVILGQPKTTSEYIQASSRVGRDDKRPGLVIVLLNPNRPRDQSYYERFKSHQLEITEENDFLSVIFSKQGLVKLKTSSQEQALEIVRRRIDEVGTNEPNILKRGNDRILVELPGLDDPMRIKTLLGKTANLTFRFVSNNNEDSFGNEKLDY